VFILIDRPDPEQDSLLSDHVMALHIKPPPGTSTATGSAVRNPLQSPVVHPLEISCTRLWKGPEKCCPVPL